MLSTTMGHDVRLTINILSITWEMVRDHNGCTRSISPSGYAAIPFVPLGCIMLAGFLILDS
jgi:hypothetical protein